MTGAGVVIRPATVDDAEGLGRCHLRCWQEAYAGRVDADRLAELTADEDRRIARWRQTLGAAHGTVLALDQDDVVGFASSGPGRDPDLALPVELYALYTRAGHWGTGLGLRLLRTVVGDADTFCWVLRDNPRARAFYTRQGFRLDGTEKYDAMFDAVEVRMVRRPTAA